MIQVIIAGTVYSKLSACSTQNQLFKSTTLSGGGVGSAQIDVTLISPGELPRGAKVELYEDETAQGVFWIDTRETDDDGNLVLHGYDAMLRAEEAYLREGDTGAWPRPADVVVAEIASRMGVEIDPRTEVWPYLVPLPADYTMREVLSFVAASQAANWTMTPEGKLRLIGINQTGGSLDVGRTMSDFTRSPEFLPISRVTIWYDDENAFTAGDDTGRTLELDCPWATQEMADKALEAVKGYVYRPYTASNALLPPGAVLGDTVTVNGVESLIAVKSTTYGALSLSSISAPEDEEIDHEYPYISGQQRALKRKVTLGASYYGTSISRKEGLVIRKTDGETVSAQAMLNADRLTFQALKNGRLQDCIYFDAAAGKYRLTGDVLIDGALSTESLYASYGDVANLAVNRLTTSRRIVKYLAKDTTDDNYVAIQDQQIQLVAGVYAGGTEQARDPDGAVLYWEEDPTDAAIGSDGYPYIDGIRIFTTTTETQWPVMVYTYTDQVKRSISFEQIGEFYTPVDTFGVGDQAGNRIGQLIKNDTGLMLSYKAADGSEIALTFLDDGYTDLTGLRKITSIDFSSLAGGTFAVTLEGISEAYQFGVNYGANGLPSEIIYPGGASCAITWG